MYSTIATTILALSGAALAAPAGGPVKPQEFGLHAFTTGGDELVYWAVVNAHIGAGMNALQIQRPAAYQSDPAYFNGTEVLFDLGTEYPWGLRMPSPEAGTVGEVTSSPGDGTVGFAVDGEILTYNKSPEGFYACPVNDVFTLFWGQNPEPANVEDCLEIQLHATA